MKKLRIILQSRYLFKILAFFFVIYALIFTNIFKQSSIYKSGYNVIDMKLNSFVLNDDKVTMYLDGNEKLIGYYYIKSKDEYDYILDNFESGICIRLYGDLEEVSNNTVFNLFNYRKYLYNNHIFYKYNINSFDIINGNDSVLYFLKNKIINRIDRIDNSGYLRIFIVGDKSLLDKDIYNVYQENGVSHLFSISGMHISFLVCFMMFFLKKFTYNNALIFIVIDAFLLFYLFLTSFGASVLRCTIMYFVLSLSNIFNLRIKSLDCILIVLIVVIIIDPFYIYNMGFQFSYLTSFFIILFQKRINSFKPKLLSSLYLSFLCFMVSFPICIYNFYQVNILSIIFNIILVPIVSLIVFPLTLLVFIFPFLYNILSYLYFVLEVVNLLFNKVGIFKLVFLKPNILFIFVYYFLLFCCFYNRKFFNVLVLLIIVYKNYLLIDNTSMITYLDVGQGDSLLIKYSNSNKVILIDTGGIVSFSNNSINNSISNYKIIPYIKSLGVKKISVLVISHGDNDHCGEAINLVENFNVEKVIFNCGDYNYLEKELIKVLDKKKIPYYSCINELNIDNNKLYFLKTKEYDNENDNSNVIYTEIDGYKFMFMGDAGVDKEKDILDKYNISNIDVLKVGHHGSKTSSSKEFVNEINPKYSIISVGKNNRYGHPNKEVLNNLNNSKIYRTDQDGSIMFKIKNNKLKIDTCSP